MFTSGPYSGEARCLKHKTARAVRVPGAQFGGCNGTRQGKNVPVAGGLELYGNINAAKQIKVPTAMPVTSVEDGLVIKAPRTIANLSVHRYVPLARVPDAQVPQAQAPQAQAGSGQG